MKFTWMVLFVFLTGAPIAGAKTVEELKRSITSTATAIPVQWRFSEAFLGQSQGKVVAQLTAFDEALTLIRDMDFPEPAGVQNFFRWNESNPSYFAGKRIFITFNSKGDRDFQKWDPPEVGAQFHKLSLQKPGRIIAQIVSRKKSGGTQQLDIHISVLLHNTMQTADKLHAGARAFIISELLPQLIGEIPLWLEIQPNEESTSIAESIQYFASLSVANGGSAILAQPKKYPLNYAERKHLEGDVRFHFDRVRMLDGDVLDCGPAIQANKTDMSDYLRRIRNNPNSNN